MTSRRPKRAKSAAARPCRPTARTVTLERAFQAALGGGCQTAFGAHATPDHLYLFHETIGLHRLPLTDADFADPAATAARNMSPVEIWGMP